MAQHDAGPLAGRQQAAAIRSHCDCEGPGTTLHLYTLLTRYLLSNIPAGPR